MSGQRSRNFSTNLSKKMNKNCIVKQGWYYRRSPIISCETMVGIIIKEPYWEEALIEKLKYSKKSNSYSIEDAHEYTYITEVLWNDNSVEICALKNLVKIS